MTETTQALIRGRDLAWGTLRPAFDHAIAMAREAEYVAAHASNLAQTWIEPSYPPLVSMLADAGRE